MPKKLNSEVEYLTRNYSREGLSIRAIVKKLEASDHQISKSTVSNIVNCIGNRRNHKLVGMSSPKKPQPSKKVTKDILRKIDLLTDKENPPSQSFIAKKFNLAQTTVSFVIRKKLGKKIKKKTVVHALKPSHIANRKKNSIGLYKKRLAGQKSEFVVTLDEALFFLDDCKGSRKIYYKKPGKLDPEFMTVKKEKFGKKFMVVGAISGRGILPLIKVPQNVKINSEYYIENVLKPFLEVEIPKLYPGEESKVFVHHDAASSHTSKKTELYGKDLKERLGMTIIPTSEIPVKSPDTSPMDFFGFGMLKQKLHSRKASTMKGVWKLLQKEWNKITLEMIGKVFDSWKWRLRLVNEKNGEQIEQTKKIHKRKL